MANFGDRITDLIGTYTGPVVNSSSDLFYSSLASIVDTISPDILVKYAINPVDLNNTTPTWTSVEGAKVIMVTRLDGVGGVDRSCKMISIPEFSKAQDPLSVHYATNLTPVTCLVTDAGTTSLQIFPTPTATETAKVYHFVYASGGAGTFSVDTPGTGYINTTLPTSGGTGTGLTVTIVTTGGAITSATAATVGVEYRIGDIVDVTDSPGGGKLEIVTLEDVFLKTSINGLPDEAEQAVIILTSINMLQAYISNAVQDEEDTETLQMVTAQVASLQSLLQLEMARFTEGKGE